MATRRTKLSIGIAGVGVVGGALKTWFEQHTQHELKLYDPDRGFNDDLSKSEVCFLCVPVPTNADGTQDYSMLEDARGRCAKTTFIRSTVMVGINDNYQTFSCPEFLTERSRTKDMAECKILTGCPDIELMTAIFPNKKIIRLTNKECELAKYAHNAMGAVKVNFFNLIYNICELNDLDYKQVLKGVLSSGYIERTHTQVAGPDGFRGFGGKCFPKDLRALHHFFPTQTFEACLEENSIHRTLK